jgi:L-serine dehydratase
MRFFAYDAAGLARERTYYSVGGGFVVDETAAGAGRIKADDTQVRYPFKSAAELLTRCEQSGLAVSGVMLANETSWRPAGQVSAGLLHIGCCPRPTRVTRCGSWTG